MKVTIIVGGRFHAFNLAEQLNKDKFLKQLITSYPKYYLKKNFQIADNLITSLPLKELLFRFSKKINLIDEYFDIDLLTSNIFENAASKKIDYQNTDIILGWSSFSLKSFEIANKHNCIKILERGSSHIEFQKDILKEEYDLIGLNPKIPSKKIIDKEIKEYDLSDYISVPSVFSKKSFLEKGFSEKKVFNIPYGVDLNNFFLSNEIKNDDEFNIISVGAISVRKGSIYLLKAFNELNLKNTKLIFIGDIERGFEKILNMHLNDNIKIIKSVSQNSLRNFYHQASVFVTCPVEDGFGMVILQAMACGLPIIVTNNAGGSEIIDDGVDGYVIPIRDKERLKEKLLFLYHNREELLVMGKKAEHKAKNFFSWKNYGEKIENFYLSLVKDK